MQETFLRWQAADRDRIEMPEAWLTKVLTNLCLNQLTSARARRETYVGQWLPEPLLAGDPMLGPADTAEQRESVSIAVLTLMERLSPNERAVYVLREAFDYPHREIAEILDITEANCQQIYRRAKQHVAAGRARARVDAAAARRIVEEFLAAAPSGETEPLVRLLDRRRDRAWATAAARSRPAPSRSSVRSGSRGSCGACSSPTDAKRRSRSAAASEVLRRDRQRRPGAWWSWSATGSSASCPSRSPPRASPPSASRSTPTSSNAPRALGGIRPRRAPRRRLVTHVTADSCQGSRRCPVQEATPTPDRSETMKHRIVVLGAGYAGAIAAGRLAKRLHRDDVAITLVNAEPDFVERVRMHQLAAGQDLRPRALSDMFAGTGVAGAAREGHRRRRRPQDRRHRRPDGADELAYDTLVYALGSAAADHGVPGVAEHAYERRRQAGRAAAARAAGAPRRRADRARRRRRPHRHRGRHRDRRGPPGPRRRPRRPRRPRRLAQRQGPAAPAGVFDRLGITVHEHAAITRRRRRPAWPPPTAGPIPAEVTVWTAGFAVHPIAAATDPGGHRRPGRSSSTAPCARSRTPTCTPSATPPSRGRGRQAAADVVRLGRSRRRGRPPTPSPRA